jgi:hypothetical protein
MKTPKPQDPVAVAGAQAGQNTLSANANTIANSGTVTDPYGTKTSDLEYVQVMNPLTGNPESVARNNTTQTLSPEQQKIFDQNQSSDYNLASYGNTQAKLLNSPDVKPFDYTTGDHESWFAKNFDALNAEGNARADEALRTRLANQGIKGGDAFNQQLKAQSSGQSDARLQALLGAQGQGFQQAQAKRNQQFNEPLAISSGTQIQNPNYQGANVGNVGTVDYAGIRSNYDQQRMAGFNAKQQMLGGLFGGIGSAFGVLSEPSMKTDKKKLPMKTPDGLQMWAYRYKGESKAAPIRIGVMADEAERKMPDAVVRGGDGLRRVNMEMALGA